MTRQELFTWIRLRYGTEPEYPWHDWNAVLRHNDNIQLGKPELDDAIKDLLSLSYELTAPKKRNLKSSGKNQGDSSNGKEKEIDEG